jgi:phosphoketolase
MNIQRCTDPLAENLMSDFLSPEQLQRLDAYWRASNYLAAGQIYLKDNPLLKQPLSLAHRSTWR